MKSSNRKPFVTAVILCAGSGQRANLGYNKIFHAMAGAPVIRHTVQKFTHVDHIVVVGRADELDHIQSLLADFPDILYASGGDTRTKSVRNGLQLAPPDTDIVLIHDGARPYVSEDIISRTITAAANTGSGIAAVSETNAVKQVGADGNVQTLRRESVYCVQTPQAFRFNEMTDAYSRIAGDYSDDSEVFERAGYTCTLVEGAYENIKLTNAVDFLLPSKRHAVGYGFDVHRLAEKRALIIGGVRIEHRLGLVGHSDADVLTHAVMDALLSAAGLPDIGHLFPDRDPAYKDADSVGLLTEVGRRLAPSTVESISACIIAEQPKMAPHIPAMRQRLADALGIEKTLINISATTTETLGVTGEEKGIAAAALALLKHPD